MIDAAWAPALDAAATAPLTIVIGPGDAGKTTLVTALANALFDRGFSVGIVDADVGQSVLGPPTTVGVGRVTRVLQRPGDAELIAMAFVGATSPAANLTGTVVATGRMVARARAQGIARVLVDTGGLIAGDLGRALKQAKIDLLDPDLVVCLERGDECETVLRPYRAVARPRVVRLAPSPAARPRNAETRRRFREEALARYFAGSRRIVLDLRSVVLKRPALFGGEPLSVEKRREASAAIGHDVIWAERRHGDTAVLTATALTANEGRRLARIFEAGPVVAYAVVDLVGTLAGVDDAAGETTGLGVVRAIGIDPPSLELETPVAPDAIAVVTIGRAKF
ncbi:MAG: hypothetical protein AUH30_20740 [Candidatus Rokubacteria bacterium 13_1_40CM_68_15]|nr:MAG: hypothetical protein AUH30_20740 [Candidatus Rokubacteria bacterium 13_1_40CM_68_15]